MNNPYQVVAALNRETSFIVWLESLFYLKMSVIIKSATHDSRCKYTATFWNMQIFSHDFNLFYEIGVFNRIGQPIRLQSVMSSLGTHPAFIEQ